MPNTGWRDELAKADLNEGQKDDLSAHYGALEAAETVAEPPPHTQVPPGPSEGAVRGYGCGW